MRKKRIVILGSTGSIGQSTLAVVRRYPKRFKVIGLTAYNNTRLLKRQIEEFKPTCVAASNKVYHALSDKVSGVKWHDVEDDLLQIVTRKDVDVVVIGMRGAAALAPFMEAVKAGKTIAPANKEALVIAGEMIMQAAQKYGAQIIPVDSEQSAIFQCLEGYNVSHLKRVILTASGGALRTVPQQKFNDLSVDDILAHPRWKMGAKITVDSASLMNKGFEVIEAQRLFGLSADQIDVLVHPEAIIHSMVEYCDGSIIAQMAQADMQLPIQYAMTYPERMDTALPSVDFVKLQALHFEKPDTKKFPALALAFDVARKGGSLPCVLNAADEVAVEAFLEKKIKFTNIYSIVSKVIKKHQCIRKPSLKDIIHIDQWARDCAQAAVG